MRISKAQLQDIVNEEVARALLRKENRRLIEAHEPGGSLYNVDASALLAFAKDYADLGVRVQEQIEDLLDRQEDAEIDIDVFDIAERTFRGTNRELDAAMDAWYSGNVGSDNT